MQFIVPAHFEAWHLYAPLSCMVAAFLLGRGPISTTVLAYGGFAVCLNEAYQVYPPLMLENVMWPALPALPSPGAFAKFPALPPLGFLVEPLIWVAGAIFAGIAVKMWWTFRLYIMELASAFNQIELELNGLIKKYKGHGSRLQRVEERRQWYDTIAKKDSAIGRVLMSNAPPFPHTISDDIIGWNEKEAQSKKEARGQAVATAYYLTLLLRSSGAGVRRKIAAERAKGKEPFLVPGVEYLAAQHWRMLQYTVHTYKFPRRLTMKKDSGYIHGWDVLHELIQE